MVRYLPAVGLGILVGAGGMLGVWMVFEATRTPCPCKEHQQHG